MTVHPSRDRYLNFSIRSGKVWYALVTFLYVDILGMSFAFLTVVLFKVINFLDTTG